MKPRLLDLFCGAGGAAKGYQRAGFYVVGVDIKPQPHYCGDEFHQANAMIYPLEGFDVIHASPPCQFYSTLTSLTSRRSHISLISEVRERIRHRLYVIENVLMAKLISPVTLCGTHFFLGVIRHRMFESNIPLVGRVNPCDHKGKQLFTVLTKSCRKTGDMRGPSSHEAGKVAMGIDWMTQQEMGEAIPPAYTEFIGQQLMRSLEEVRECL
ncbi:MAG: hypothetical protein Q8P35_00605 [Candidatus Yanofskybacteria bacterium]|nr:hypothetical protein [Candidatus Yanofskybacteria bacterium]